MIILPNELCQMIISYLPAQDRFSLAQTTKHMHQQVHEIDRTRIIVVLSKMNQLLFNNQTPPQQLVLEAEQENIDYEQIVRHAEYILKELETKYPQAYKNQVQQPVSIEQKTMGMFREIVQSTTSHSFNLLPDKTDDWLPIMQALNVVENETPPGPSNHQLVCNNLKKYQEILSLTDLRPHSLNDNIFSFYYLSQTYSEHFKKARTTIYTHVLPSLGLTFQLINYSLTNSYLSNGYGSCPFPDICDYMIDARGTNLLLLYSFLDFLLTQGPPWTSEMLQMWLQRLQQKDFLLYEYAIRYFPGTPFSHLPIYTDQLMQQYEQNTSEIVAQSLCNNNGVDQDKKERFINTITQCLSKNTSPLDINKLAHDLPAKPILMGIIDQIKYHPFPYQVYKKNIPKLVKSLIEQNKKNNTLLKDILYHKPPQYCLQLFSLVIDDLSLRNDLTIQCTHIITKHLEIGARWYQYIKYEANSDDPFNCIQSGLLLQILFPLNGQVEILNQLFKTWDTSDKQRFFIYIQHMPMDVERLVFQRKYSFFQTLVKYIKRNRIILSSEELNWMQKQGYIKRPLHKIAKQIKQRVFCTR